MVTDTKSPGEKTLSVTSTKTLTLKPRAETGVVRQSFSHGRSKAVVVEKVKRRIGGPQLIGDQLGVVDVEGYLHLLSRSDGAYVGRLATDGSPATAQPLRLAGGIVWQSLKGTVYAVNAK